jgi:hypothetical protein
MNSVTNRIEAAGATIGSGAAMASSVADANHWLQFAIGVATLAWWLRLWIKDPNQKPPSK